ncbi:MAG TPA: hypothetical protein VN132_03315, partial [Bdellovibrio sp.]|nr:hypothetical protein [Bdellovibrio sp.]
MKIFKILILASALLLGRLSLAGDIKVNPYGMTLKGDLLTAEIATLEEKNAAGLNDVLIRFTGQDAAAAGIDGKVIRYETQHGGTGIDFKYKDDGAEKNRMSSRNPWGD